VIRRREVLVEVMLPCRVRLVMAQDVADDPLDLFAWETHPTTTANAAMSPLEIGERVLDSGPALLRELERQLLAAKDLP
jgi:hypothetical protein